MAAPPRDASRPGKDGVEPEVLQQYFTQGGRFTAGLATQSQESVLTGAPIHQQLATGFPIGMRFHSAPVIRVADARPLHLGHVAKADGRWRLYAFADRPSATEIAPRLHERLRELLSKLLHD